MIIAVAVAAFLLIISVAGKTAEIPEEEFSFADLKNIEFWFGNGAGGWRTVLTIEADGSFSGEYSDSEMGSTRENYSAGTVYYCEFSGKFTEPVKVNDDTYSMQIAEILYENEPETEEIRDGPNVFIRNLRSGGCRKQSHLSAGYFDERHSGGVCKLADRFRTIFQQ